jgi:hypothetical protein
MKQKYIFGNAVIEDFANFRSGKNQVRAHSTLQPFNLHRDPCGLSVAHELQLRFFSYIFTYGLHGLQLGFF